MADAVAVGYDGVSLDALLAAEEQYLGEQLAVEG
jgi:hypothetical protein